MFHERKEGLPTYHAFSRPKIPVSDEVFPAKDADKEEDGWHCPGDDNEDHHLARGSPSAIPKQGR